MVKIKKDNETLDMKEGISYIYLLTILPTIGIIISLIYSIANKKGKIFFNFVLNSIFLYLFAGAMVYVLMKIMVLNSFSLILFFSIIALFWVIIPVYMLYYLTMYSSDIIITEKICAGYVLISGDFITKERPWWLFL